MPTDDEFGDAQPRSARAGSAGLPPGSGRRRRPVSRRQKVLGGLAVFVAVVLVGGSLFGYLKYRAAWDGIARVDVSGDLHTKKRPAADPNAENILLIGSDTRVGVNGKIGGDEGIEGARSDTIIVVHIAPGAHQVDVLSLPRDSVVPVLACTAEGGTPGQSAEPSYDIEQINATLAYGGPGCLWETIEQTTGIHINDFVELTFSGFEKVVNQLGGVNVCLPYAVDDPMSGLDLSAGDHHVYGPEALAFWRTREDLGTQSDLQRIQRDQFLMASLFRGIESSSLLTSPRTMLSIIGTLTSQHDVVTDSGLTPAGMLRIVEALRGLNGSSVQFVTAPATGYTGNAVWAHSSQTPTSGNPNWVQWAQPAANTLFSQIAHDTKLPPAAPSHATTPPQPAVAVSPADVHVQVLNGTSTPNLAGTTSQSLTQRGFDVVGEPGDASSDTYTDSVIEYPAAAELPEAQTLAKVVGNATVQQDPTLDGQTVELILGSSFTALAPAAGSPAGSSSSSQLSSIAHTYNGITGNVDICKDSNAFSS
jgi:LCP family protein required for cell wall assembly